MPPPLLLLVDDASEIVHIVRLLARRSGQEFLSYSSASAALDALRAAGAPRPDLLLLDIHLPGINGVELYRLARQPPDPIAGVPAALFSQGMQSAILASALDAGIDFVVSKELLGRPEGWKERIDEVLHIAAHPPVLARPPGPLDARRLEEGLRLIFLHPVLTRLGDEAIQAIWRRCAARAQLTAQAGVDVSVSSDTLLRYFAPPVTDPESVACLLLCLGHQVECVLGQAVSAPLRAAIADVLNEAGTESRQPGVEKR